MKTNSTKKALLASLLSLLLCASMLVGSTFAWFTDTASTAVNSIQAGTLKVELWKGDSNESLGSEPLKWVAADGRAQNEILWEPGATYSLESFRIKNAGNLALKYKVVINGLVGSAKLLEAIDFTVTVDGTLVAKNGTSTATTAATLNNFEGKLGAGAVTGKITITGHMKEDAGNEYMNEKIEGISITVVATQDTVEKDGTGDQYDKDAAYPTVLVGEVKAGEATVIRDKDEDHTLKFTAPAGSMTTADGETVEKIYLEMKDSATPANITLTSGEKSTSVSVTLKNQDGKEVIASGEHLFEVEMNIGKNRSNVRLYHSGVLMVNDGATLTDAHDHYIYNSTTGIVTMKVGHFSPFTAVYDVWNGQVAEDYATPVDETNKVVTVANAAELALLAKQVNSGTSYKDYTVKLTDDIDLDGNAWTPIGKSSASFNGIFDGQGHTISNLWISRKWTNDVGLFGYTQHGEVKNFTLHNADVTGYLDVGAIAGTPYTSKYTNISLTGDVQVNGYAYVGGMLGKNAYANLTDLTIDVNAGSCVKADSGNYRTYVGGLVGFMGEGNQVVKNVTSNIDVIGSTCDVGGITGIAHYGNSFINCHSSGNVTLLAAPDAGVELEIGGIAGVWHDETGYTVTFDGCTYTGTLSSTNVTTGKVTNFENNGLVGRKYGSGNGTLIIK